MPASKAAQANAYRNRIVARIGYLTARYMSPAEISADLGGEVTPADVEMVLRAHGIRQPVLPPGHELIEVPVAGRHRTLISREAMARGIEMPALAASILCRTVDDDLFAAILDR